MASNFIIFFEEKEGTSPLVRMLDNFSQIDIIHQVDGKGWEPFNSHNCGAMSHDALRQCLESIYGSMPLDMEALNGIYTQTAQRSLEQFNKDHVLGCKMRFDSPIGRSSFISRLPFVGQRYSNFNNTLFSKLMYRVLAENEVVALVAVRQDVLRQALSKYHGDGSGNAGHLQFKLADGLIQREDIAKIHVNCERLNQLITACERSLSRKRTLIKQFSERGIKTHVLLYEEFCSNKEKYFTDLFNFLDVDVSAEDISNVIQKDTRLQKVHSDDISEFVMNAEEVLERFENRYAAWA